MTNRRLLIITAALYAFTGPLPAEARWRWRGRARRFRRPREAKMAATCPVLPDPPSALAESVPVAEADDDVRRIELDMQQRMSIGPYGALR